MSKKSGPERITLTFDLHDLPTAQHRAGLGGLLLQIDSMKADGNQRDPKRIPDIEELTPTSATIAFTPESMQGIFDDVYAAEPAETTVTSKWPGTAPKRETTIEKKDSTTGGVKQVRAFVYDVVQPQAPCLYRHIQPDARAWITLWRQMIWEIPRGGNNVRSRAPFIETAGGKSCSEGSKAWTQIIKFLEKRAKSLFETDQISGALLLGAQAINAEGVPFSGRIDHNLLLHFWQVVVLPFLPRVVNKKEGKIERYGYVLTIPDVDDLREFRREYPKVLGSLGTELFRGLPATAQIDLPDQANLEMLRQLNQVGRQETTAKAAGRATRRGRVAGATRHMQALATDRAVAEFGSGGVRAIESYHMVKQGNNVKLISFARVADRPGLTEEYGRIKRSYRSPLFGAMRMRALIRGEPWHAGMIELFAEYPWPFFIEGDDTPRYFAPVRA
jgi:CRISPR-associated protein Cmx8